MAQTTANQGAAGSTPWPVAMQPATTGGLSVYRSLDVNATGQVAKNAAGQLYGYYLYNNSAATRYVKLYNQSGAPASTDTPLMTLPIPAGAAANVAYPSGIAFSAGIGIRATTGIADNDNAAPGTNDVVVNLYYK